VSAAKIQPPDVIDENRRYSIPVGSALLGQSEAQTWKDIKAGRLQVIRDGARTYLHGSTLIRRSREGLPERAA